MRNPPSIFAVHAGQSDKHTLPSVEQLRLDSSRSFQHSGSMSAAKRSSSQLFKQDSSKRPKIGGSITSFFGGLKSGPPLTSAKGSATLAFNKDEWVATLTPEQRELLKLEIATLGADWIAVLKSRLVTKEFLELKRFLKREIESGVQVFPPAKDIYSWSRFTPLHNVKVLIVGQDPYHGQNQAHGLCFSVRPPTPAPPSLKNIFTAIHNDYPSFQRPAGNGGLLTPWAERGVLMLNTCLTVRAHQANSHAKRGWEDFTQKVIDTVASVRTRGVVFMAWGTPAGQRVAKIDRKRHLVLQAVHPSPLSAHRGFLKCGHFKQANEWLAQRYGEDGPIDWSLVPSDKSGEQTKSSVTTESATSEITTVAKAKTDKTARRMENAHDGEFDDDELEALLASEEGLN